MFVTVNGIQLYYEVAGQGPAMLLLHGNGEDHTTFDVLAKRLESRYTLYMPDSRGHGQSSPVPHLTYDEMAMDAAAFIRQLGLERPVVLGFSDGGIVALLLACRCPDLVGKLVVCGANRTPKGLRAGTRRAIRLANLLHHSDKLDLMLQQPHITDKMLGAITAPTLVLAGEKDMILPQETRAIARAIPGARLLVLPGEDHGSYVEHSDTVWLAMKPFLTGR